MVHRCTIDSIPLDLRFLEYSSNWWLRLSEQEKGTNVNWPSSSTPILAAALVHLPLRHQPRRQVLLQQENRPTPSKTEHVQGKGTASVVSDLCLIDSSLQNWVWITQSRSTPTALPHRVTTCMLKALHVMFLNLMDLQIHLIVLWVHHKKEKDEIEALVSTTW